MRLHSWIVLFVLSICLSASAQLSKAAPKATRVEGELLVKFAPGFSEAGKDKVHHATGAKLKRKFNFIGWQHVTLPKGLSIEKAKELYRKQPGVVDVAENAIGGIDVFENKPNDPAFSGDLLWSLRKISAPGAWVGSTGNSEIVVAVVDTGIDYNHPDLAANIWRNSGEIPANGLDDDNNGYVDDTTGFDFGVNDANPMDEDGHGTHVAGTIGAVGNNNLGVTGVNWNVKLMPIKIFSGSGPTLLLLSTDVITGLEYVAAMIDRGVNVRVANHSYSFLSLNDSGPLRDAMTALTISGRNVTNVCSAGNGGADAIGDDNDTTPTYPANFDIVGHLSVAATNSSDQLAAFSNFGNTLVDLAAPGVDIYSTSPTTLPSNANYQKLNGTSMASPHVAGAAALILAMRPVLTPSQVKAALMQTADSLPQLQGKVVTMGRLNVRRAMWSFDQGNPEVVIATEYSNYRNSLAEIHGFAREYNSAIGEVNIRLQRGLEFWTGTAWKTTPPTDPEVQLKTTLAYDGLTTWEWSCNQMPTGANLNTNTYTVTAIAEDLPGYTATATSDFILDLEPPSLVLSKPGTAPTTAPVVGDWIGGTAGDNSGAPTVTVKITRIADGFQWNGQVWANAISELPCNIYDINKWAVSSRLPEDLEIVNGQYSVAAKAVDAAGNFTSETRTFAVNVNRIFGDTTGNPTVFDESQFQRPSLTLPERNPAPALTYSFTDTSRYFSTRFVAIAPNGGYYSGIGSSDQQFAYNRNPGSILIRHDANGVELWRLARQRLLENTTNGSQGIAKERWSDSHSYYTLDPFSNEASQHDFGSTRLDAMTTDAQGNLYAGFIYGSGYEGKGPFCVILKFDPSGNQVWRKSVFGSGHCSIKNMVLLSDNSVAVLLASNNLETPTLARVGSANDDFSIRLTAAGVSSRALFMGADATDALFVVSDETQGSPLSAEDSTGYIHTLRKFSPVGTLAKTLTVKPSTAPEKWLAIKMTPGTSDLYVCGSMMLTDTDGHVVVSRYDLNQPVGSERLWRSHGPFLSTGSINDSLRIDCNSTGIVLSSFTRTTLSGCLTKFSTNGVMLWSRSELEGDLGFNLVDDVKSLSMDAVGNVYVASYYDSSDVLAKLAANGDVQFVRTLGNGFANLRAIDTPMLLLPSANNPTKIGLAMDDTEKPDYNQSGLYFFNNPGVQPVQLVMGNYPTADLWINAGGSFTLRRTVTGTRPVTYQWKHLVGSNYENAPNGTSNVLSVTNATAALHGGDYYMQASNVVNTAYSGISKVWVTSPTTLASALDSTGFTWTTSGSPLWAGQSGGNSRSGGDSAMIIGTTKGQTGSLRSSVTGPGTLRFQWFQTSEYITSLELYVNGVKTKTHDYTQYGVQEVGLTDGTHTLEWRFTAFYDNVPGAYPSRGFVDNVSFTSSVVPVVSILAHDSTADEPQGNMVPANKGTFRILRSPVSTSPLTVNFSLPTGTGKATFNTDYSLTGAATSSTAIIPANATFVDVVVSPKSDLQLEGLETASMFLATGTGYTIGSTITAAIGIGDTLQKPYIYGRVLDDAGNGLPGVSVARISSIGGSTLITNTKGEYCFMALHAPNAMTESHIVTPASSGKIMYPVRNVISLSSAAGIHADFLALTGLHIAGQIRQDKGAGLTGAVVKLSGTLIDTAPTTNLGYYGFSNLRAGSFVVTPTRTGYAFYPGNSPVTIAAANVPGIDFLALTGGTAGRFIVGQLFDGTAKPISGGSIAIKKETAAFATVRSNTRGYYGLSNAAAANYTVTPTLTGWTFFPGSYTGSTSAATWKVPISLGLKAPFIQGRVTNSLTPSQPLVNIVVRRGTTSTSPFVKSSPTGYYGFSSVPAGSYVIKPEAIGKVFTPLSKSVSVTATTNSTNNDFKSN